MRKLLFMLLLIPVLGTAQTQSRVDTANIRKVVIQDSSSTALVPARSPAGKGEIRSRGSSGLYYITYNAKFRLDTTYTFGPGAQLSDTIKIVVRDTVRAYIDSTLAQRKRVNPFAVYSWTTVDSFLIVEMPVNSTLDSVRIRRTGGTSATVNATRDRGGSVVDLLSANYAATTSMAKPTGLQNGTLLRGDLINFTIRAIVGTVKELYIQIYYH